MCFLYEGYLAKVCFCMILLFNFYMFVCFCLSSFIDCSREICNTYVVIYASKVSEIFCSAIRFGLFDRNQRSHFIYKFKDMCSEVQGIYIYVLFICFIYMLFLYSTSVFYTVKFLY